MIAVLANIIPLFIQQLLPTGDIRDATLGRRNIRARFPPSCNMKHTQIGMS